VANRGFTEEDFEQVASYFDRAVGITQEVQKETGSKLKDFKAVLQDGAQNYPKLVALDNEVKTFARSFPTVGF
jgi:glycine hydroxymethyltransferase